MTSISYIEYTQTYTLKRNLKIPSRQKKKKKKKKNVAVISHRKPKTVLLEFLYACKF